MSDLSGELIDGRYQLLRQVANGGMATIYEALDTRLDRKVAVKIMHAHLAQDEAFVSRFIREAKAAAALTHPNIVAVQDQGWNQSGIPAVFLVMEFIEGHTLREYLNERGRFEIKDAINYLTPILSALAAQRGIADSRSDVYAAGIVAYEMFTGEKPFNGDSPIQIAYMHVNEEIPHLRSKRKEIPQALDDLIASATAKNPDDRPRTAGEFLERLQQIQIELDPKKNQLDLGLDLPVEPIREKARKKVKEEPVKEATVEVKESTREIKRREEKKKRASKRVRRNRKVALILAVALGVGGWWTLVGPGSRVVVPSTVGGSYDEAVSSFTPLGLTAVILENRYDEEIAKGRIIESEPPGGGKVDAGGSVKLIISKGPERYTIPSTTGLTPEAAQVAISKSPLTIGAVTEVFNSDIPAGFVISSTPAAGSSVKRDSKVDLIVSKGIEQVALASYIGKSGEQALNELTEAGFNVEAGYAFSETTPELAVISQSPAGGTTANKGGKVTILISKGPRYTFIPKTIITMEANAGKAMLESLGLKVKVVSIGNAKKKVVKKVSPAVNTKVLRGSLVTITVG